MYDSIRSIVFGAFGAWSDRLARSLYICELCHLYPYPCPKKFYKLPAVLFCYTNLFYKMAWAWAWV